MRGGCVGKLAVLLRRCGACCVVEKVWFFSEMLRMCGIFCVVKVVSLWILFYAINSYSF